MKMVGNNPNGNTEIDKNTGASINVGYEHHEIHSGNHFFSSDYALNQASGGIIEFIVITPPGAKHLHLTFDFSASEGATAEVYKGTTDIVGGSPLTPLNNNGNSLNTSIATILKDPTSMTDGVRLPGFLAGGGRTSGFNSREKEIVLQSDSTYMIRVTSLAVSNDMGWNFEWYEHTDRTL